MRADQFENFIASSGEEAAAAALSPFSCIYLSYAAIRPDFNVKSSASAETVGKIRRAAPKAKLVLTLGDRSPGGMDGFSDVAGSPPARAVFIRGLAAFLEKRGFDGVELYWDAPGSARSVGKNRPSDRSGLTAFVSELSEKTGGPISLRAQADAWWAECVDISALRGFVGSWNILTDSFTGHWDTETKHISNLRPSSYNPVAYKSLDIESVITRFEEAGIPSGGLCFSYAARGREFLGVFPHNNGLYQKFNIKDPSYWPGGLIPYSVLTEFYIGKNGFERFWDDDSYVPYLYNAETRAFISYDDEDSLTAKAGFAKLKKTGGLICRDPFADTENKLIKAYLAEYNK
ncbi:MAG: glycoside hydrolase family 18 protein [Clostridiales bacterium]|nr:glycoside hydrolase family 18 protein [Clostridiales bacterium]